MPIQLTPAELEEIESRYTSAMRGEYRRQLSESVRDIPALLAEIKALTEEHSIVWIVRSYDFHVSVDGKPELWAAGRTIAEAVGDLVMSHRDHFEITVKPQASGRISEEGK